MFQGLSLLVSAMKEKQIATEELDCESIMSLISESEDALCE